MVFPCPIVNRLFNIRGLAPDPFKRRTPNVVGEVFLFLAQDFRDSARSQRSGETAVEKSGKGFLAYLLSTPNNTFQISQSIYFVVK